VLVDQVSLILRQLMRQARHRVKVKGSLVSTSINTFMEFVESYPNLIRLLTTDVASGPKPFRESIQREIRFFSQELVDDLSGATQNATQPLANIPEAAEMMVLLVFHQGVAFLEMDTAARKQLISKLNIELRMVLAGSHALYLENQKS